MFPLPVDVPSDVVIWKCNKNPQQQWSLTVDNSLKLANTSSFSEAPLLLLTISETLLIKAYALKLLNPAVKRTDW